MSNPKFIKLTKWMKFIRPWVFKEKNFNFYNYKRCEFIVMSYNVLSQDILLRCAYLYKNCPIEVLEWSERRSHIIQEIEIVNPDILCLQEANIDHYNDFFSPILISKGYKGLHKLRNFNMDGCAIFYKTEKFQLINYKEIEFMKNDICEFLDKPNVGLIAILKPLKSNINNHLVVATTHLFYNHKRGDIKLQQLRLLIAEIEKIAFKFYCKKKNLKIYYPILLCGDFNLKPCSELYRFIETGVLEWRNKCIKNLSSKINTFSNYCFKDETIVLKGINFNTEYNNENPNHKDQEISDVIRHHLNLKSVFYSKSKNNLDLYTTMQEDFEMVDYIFFNKNSGLKLINFRRLVDEKIMKKFIHYMPNEFLGSDHFSLIAKFSIEDCK